MMFWPVEGPPLPGLVGFYAISALLAALMVEQTGAKGWGAYVLAGGVFGWLIEGVVVNQTYEAVPFSLVWTPLAWHMVLSVMVGVVGLGYALRHSLLTTVLVCASLGLFAGLWGGYGWSALANDVSTPETALSFPVQISLAAGMMAIGHVVLGLMPTAIAPRWLFWGLLAVAFVFWAGGWGLVFFPVSLAVPILIVLSYLALRNAGTGPHPVTLGPVEPVRYAAFVLIPAIAIPLQPAIMDVSWVQEINAFTALPLVVLSSLMWLWAMWSSFRRRA